MKTLFIFFGLLFCTTIMAQTDYYAATKTFNENGYTYQCDVSASKMVTLYNKDGKYTYEKQVYKSTGEPFIMPDVGIRLTQADSWSRTKRYSIVRNAFTAAEKQRVKDSKLFVTLIINSDTGKVDEVYFQFGNFGPYATIPVSVFRKIEVELKKNIWFTPTAEGKKLNYILLCWDQDPSELI